MALTNLPPLTMWIPGQGVVPLYKKVGNYWLVLAVGTVCFLIVQRVVGSRVGRAMIALRENEALARSVGVDVTRYLVVAAVLSAGMAGAAGGPHFPPIPPLAPPHLPVFLTPPTGSTRVVPRPRQPVGPAVGRAPL